MYYAFCRQHRTLLTNFFTKQIFFLNSNSSQDDDDDGKLCDSVKLDGAGKEYSTKWRKRSKTMTLTGPMIKEARCYTNEHIA